MAKVKLGKGKRSVFGETPRREEVLEFFRKELDIDVVMVYNRLKAIAKLPSDKLMDRLALSREINAAGQNAQAAHRIWLKAKKERELFRIEFNRRKRELTREATKAIGNWMELEEISRKQITIAMVEEEMASNPDLRLKYETLMREQEELREIRDNCKSLADRWSKREGTLQTQARLLGQEREVIFGQPKNK